MTHDELLARIALHWIYADDPEFYGIGGYRKALLAVLELHKPVVSQWTKDAYPENTPMAYRRETEPKVCEECSPYFGDVGIDYPCPTIQEIEKELQ